MSGLLVHFGQGLAPDPFSTLPVCLTVGEIDRSPCQRPLLQHPPTLAQRCFEHVPVEVVHEVAHIECRQPRGLKGQTMALPISWVQEAIVLSMCTACRNHAVCRAEHIFHSLGFLTEIPALSLDDAD